MEETFKYTSRHPERKEENGMRRGIVGGFMIVGMMDDWR